MKSRNEVENYIECFVIGSAKNAVTQLPIDDANLDNIGAVIDGIPPESILKNTQSLSVWNQFLINKRINFYVAARIYAKARGSGVERDEPEDIKELVRTLAAYYHAQYSLIFECWDYLKPLAISDGLLNSESQPRDALQIILNDVFIKSFAKISKDNRPIGKQARSIHDRVTRDISDNRKNLSQCKLGNREISRMSADWDMELEASHPLLQLLLNIATKQSKKSGVIAGASKTFSQDLILYLDAQKTYHRRLYR